MNDRSPAGSVASHVSTAIVSLVSVLVVAIGVAGCGDSSADSSTNVQIDGQFEGTHGGSTGAAATYRAAVAQIGALDPGEIGITSAQAAAHAPTIERIIAASSDGNCDFGVDYALGMMGEMPHLAQQRQLARLLRADAERLADAGDLEGAARRTAAIVRMATQVGTGKVVIERVVAIAIVALATSIVEERPELREAAWKTDILNACAEFRGSVLARAPEFAADEIAIFAPWLRTASDADMRTLANDGLLYRTPAQRAAAADLLERYGVEVAEAWRSRGAKSELERLHERTKADFIFDLAPPAPLLRTMVERSNSSIAEAERALRD